MVYYDEYTGNEVKTVEIWIPDCFIPALANDDTTGLSDEEFDYYNELISHYEFIMALPIAVDKDSIHRDPVAGRRYYGNWCCYEAVERRFVTA